MSYCNTVERKYCPGPLQESIPFINDSAAPGETPIMLRDYEAFTTTLFFIQYSKVTSIQYVQLIYPYGLIISRLYFLYTHHLRGASIVNLFNIFEI